MSAEMAQKLVQGGIKAVQSGDTDLARKAFTKALKIDPNNEAAWLGMATITEGKTDKLRILKKVLEINPDSERAKEAVRRLAGADKSPEPTPEEETPEEPETTGSSIFTADVSESSSVFSTDINDDYEASSFDDELPEPPLATDPFDIPPQSATSGGSIEALRISTGDTGELSDFPIPDWSEEGAESEADDDSESIFADEPPLVEAEPEPEEEPFEIKSSEEMFARAPRPASMGQNGIPIYSPSEIEAQSEVVSADVQAYLEEALADHLNDDYNWTVKNRGRAGSGEYRNFLIQTGGAIFIAIMLIVGGLVSFVLNSPAAQRVLFAPTDTPTFTPTFTPTSTPGVTNTPSQTPQVPPTETPALLPSVTPGNPDQYFPPAPTEVYYNVIADSVLDDAVAQMDDGNLEEARELIDQVVAIEISTGSFPPIYRLSQWHLLNDDPEEARQVIEDWQETWQGDDSVIENNESLYNIAIARVNLYEAENGLGARGELIEEARTLLQNAIGIGELTETPILVPDRVNADAWILLAESYDIENRVDDALETINLALDQTFRVGRDETSLYGNTRVRMARVEILVDAGRFAEAFQELNWILELDPFLETALIRQTELALVTGQAGLGVLNAQEYLLYYPGSVEGFYLLGQAREAENKFDLALDAYSRALAGDITDENYVNDPFFLTTLLTRADLYVRQGFREQAANDFSLALDLTDNSPEIRVFRLQSSFLAGNYEDVLQDVEELSGEGELAESRISYYEGLALIELARQTEDGSANGNYRLAISALDDALARGLPSELLTQAQEYLAIANLEERNFNTALDAINEALEDGVTANRLYLRGQILEGQGSISDALLDYEYVVTWGQFYGFPFYEDALERYNTVLSRLGRR